MRRRGVRAVIGFGGAWCVLALAACTAKPPPSGAGSSESSSPSSSGSAAAPLAAPTASYDLIAKLSGTWKEATAAAKEIAEQGDDATKRAASPLIVKRMREMEEPAFRESLRPEVVRANAQTGISPTPEQLEDQLRTYQGEEIVRMMKVLAKIGGADNVAALVELAKDDKASPEVRRATIEALQSVTPPLDPAVASALASASTSEVRGAPGTAAIDDPVVSGGAVANARAVVASMAAGFRRCYNRGLNEDPDMQGTVRITAKIGKDGEVLGASPNGKGNLSPTVVNCVAARVASSQFSPPEGGAATIVIPVTLTKK